MALVRSRRKRIVSAEVVDEVTSPAPHPGPSARVGGGARALQDLARATSTGRISDRVHLPCLMKRRPAAPRACGESDAVPSGWLPTQRPLDSYLHGLREPEPEPPEPERPARPQTPHEAPIPRDVMNAQVQE